MEYIQRIRQKLGHTKILIPASAVVVLNERDEVLLHLRNEVDEWGLPGGLMDIGETATEGAAREVREETGLAVKSLRFFGVFSGPSFEVRYPGGDETAPVVLGFFTREFSGEPVPTVESLSVGFYPPEKLPANMHKDHRRFMEGFLEFRRLGSAAPVCH